MDNRSNPYLVGTLIQCERRPCYVYFKDNSKPKKAMFHRWVDNPNPEPRGINPNWWGGQYELYALVEFEDGVVAKINPASLQFADGGDFYDTAFIPLDQLDQIGKKNDLS